MNGLTALIKLGISNELVRSVNSQPISPENQTAFLQRVMQGFVWEGESNGRTCFKVRVLVIRIFYEKNNQLIPLWGNYGTDAEFRTMPFRIALYLEENSDIGEVGAKKVFEQFKHGKFTCASQKYYEEIAEVNDVPVIKEVIDVKFTSLTDMDYPFKRVSF